MTTETNAYAAKYPERYLKPGTRVVSKNDGEPGTVAQVCTFSRNGVSAWSYLVDTAYGREIWHRDDLFLPAATQA